ncbi:MAG: type IV pilus assembly protein PilM [Candidatus Melainabacteria bacterium]|nr:type IV pilus assembly protein PilM [Candidatus Melainabacteria bacterium]
MFAFRKKKGPTVGLDINSGSLTIVQLSESKMGLELVRYASQPTPPNVVREGLIADSEIVGSMVAELVLQAGIPSRSAPPTVNVVVPGQSVVTKLVPVPTGMPPEELEDVVTQEAINHVPFPIQEANLDWAIMPATERTDADGVRRVEVILAAIQKTIVDSYWRTAEIAGVQLGRMDVSYLAVIRSLSRAGYLALDDKLIMSVNIRHDATDINLVRNGMPLFSRSVLLGVETLGEAIARSLDVSLDESLSMLPQVSIFGSPAQDARLAQAAQVARTVLGDITDEVARSLEFYKSQAGDVVVEQVLLCGAGCELSQLNEFIANRLNIQTQVVDPLRNILVEAALIPPEKRATHTMILGAVTNPGSTVVPTVDLELNKELPATSAVEGLEEHRTQRVISEVQTPWFMPAISSGVGLVLVVAGLWAYFSQYDVPKKQNELAQLETDIELGKRQLKNMSNLKEDNELLTRKKKVLDIIVNQGRPWSYVLQIIRQCTPPGLQVRKVVLSGNSVTVEGSAIDFTKVSHLAINLGGSPILTDSTVEWTKRQMSTDPRVIDFGVTARLRPGVGAHPSLAGKAQVLDFSADWCEPCRQVKPIIEEAKQKYADKVEFVVLNADDQANKSLLAKYQVKSIPTLCFIDDKGNLVDKLVGFNGAQPIWVALEKVVQVAQLATPK